MDTHGPQERHGLRTSDATLDQVWCQCLEDRSGGRESSEFRRGPHDFLDELRDARPGNFARGWLIGTNSEDSTRVDYDRQDPKTIRDASLRNLER